MAQSGFGNQQHPQQHGQQHYGQQQGQQYGQQQQQYYPTPPPAQQQHQQQYPPPTDQQQQQQQYPSPTPQQQQQQPYPSPPQDEKQQSSPQATQQQPPQQLPPQQQVAVQPQQHVAAGAGGHQLQPSDSGSFAGGTYSIMHRDTNAVLNLTLQPGAAVRSKPGAMIHMSSSVQLTGKTKISMSKLLTGGSMTESTYVGPGNIALGPTLFGDIVVLHVDGRQTWTIGKDSFLACTADISKETKAQGFSQAMFSGEDLFVYRVGGQGLLWLTSFGAVDRLDLQPGEQHIVDNGHLVAWSCNYNIERAGAGGGGGSSGGGFSSAISGAMNSMKTGEGLVCRFTGPGSVYIQTRNMDMFKSFIRASATGTA